MATDATVADVDTRRLAERFGEVVARPEAELPLDEAVLLAAARFEPDLDVSAELARLDELASGCDQPTLDGLIRYLFADLGFAGNRIDYYDPRNSYLDQVVTRRLGIPISLAVLTMAVGRRVGVPLVGVGMPGHFLLRDQVDHDVFVDPFGGGRLLDSSACAAVFHAVHGPDAAFHPAYLAPDRTPVDRGPHPGQPAHRLRRAGRPGIAGGCARAGQPPARIIGRGPRRAGRGPGHRWPLR